MKSIRVLIADDSVVYRSNIKAALQSLQQIEVVGVASNGRLALQRLMQRNIDLLILDLEMPEMSGLETLKEMAANKIQCKVLVFSSVSKFGAEITLEALRLGASDFVAKPGAKDGDQSMEPHDPPDVKIRKLIEPKIAALFSDYAGKAQIQESVSVVNNKTEKYSKLDIQTFKPSVIVIGASTGGPSMLEKVFSQLKSPLSCPILVVQHMPPIFTATFAERLQKITGIVTREGQHGEPLLPDRIYLAPGNFHMQIAGTVEKPVIEINQNPAVQMVRPAVDPLFKSAAAIFGNKCLGLVLTGMGADGRSGSEEIKKGGGLVLIQDQASCVVFGMPGAVKAVGAYDEILTPDQIAELLNNKTSSPSTSKNQSYITPSY